MSKLLHKSIGLGSGSSADPAAYAAYMQHFAEAPAAVLRDCLEFAGDRPPISVSQVEPAAAIMARFCTGGMSLGAISRESHETIAVAVNRIGGKSNSGALLCRWCCLPAAPGGGRGAAGRKPQRADLR